MSGAVFRLRHPLVAVAGAALAAPLVLSGPAHAEAAPYTVTP